MGSPRSRDAGDRRQRTGVAQEGGLMPGSIDLGYLAYLAANVPPWDIARAVAVRARRAFRGGVRQVLGPVARHPALTPPFFMQVPERQRRQRLLAGPRPFIVDPSLREPTVA